MCVSVLGDPRTNQNPAILAIGIVFYRYHNVMAKVVQQSHPDWSDEEIFQRARRLVIATLQVGLLFSNSIISVLNQLDYVIIIKRWLVQNIIMYEYVPALVGQLVPDYEGYRSEIHPGVNHVFQSAAFRFGHTMIPPGLYRRDGKCNFKEAPDGKPALRLCSAWWDAAEVILSNSVEEFILGRLQFPLPR